MTCFSTASCAVRIGVPTVGASARIAMILNRAHVAARPAIKGMHVLTLFTGMMIKARENYGNPSVV